LSQYNCLLTFMHGLVRIAKQPQNPASIAQTHDPRILTIAEGKRVMRLGVVQRNPFLKMSSRRNTLTQKE
jgi:hypothetical protein